MKDETVHKVIRQNKWLDKTKLILADDVLIWWINDQWQWNWINGTLL